MWRIPLVTAIFLRVLQRITDKVAYRGEKSGRKSGVSRRRQGYPRHQFQRSWIEVMYLRSRGTPGCGLSRCWHGFLLVFSKGSLARSRIEPEKVAGEVAYRDVFMDVQGGVVMDVQGTHSKGHELK